MERGDLILPSFIRHPKNFWTGIIFLIFGLAAVVIARDYSMGSAARMGPAYFPSILGWLLIAIGLIVIGRSFFQPGEAVGKFAIKEIILVLLSVALFGVLIRGAGLVIAVLATVVLGAYASVDFRWKPVIAVAIGLALFSVLVFIKLLGLPIAMFGPWFGV
jgi:hypothetical protein